MSAEDEVVASGWHHATRSVDAHYFRGRYTICQDSDPGDVLNVNKPNRIIKKICTNCEMVFRSRVLHALRMEAYSRKKVS